MRGEQIGMNINKNKYLLSNYVFVLGVLLLLVNDQVLKFTYPSFMTGKLSDICGIIIFPFFLTFIFPKLKQNSVFAALIIFAFWKSEYSQDLIDFYNEYSLMETTRIIDYSDLFVAVLLPFPYYIIKNINKFQHLFITRLNPYVVFFPSLFIFIVEAPPPSFYYTMNNGNLKCYKCNIVVNYHKDTLINTLKENGIEFDSVKPIYYRGVVDSTSGARKCIKNQLIIDNDTLRNINMTLFPLKNNKTQIYFNGMDVPHNLKNNKKLERKLRRHYKKLVFNGIKRIL